MDFNYYMIFDNIWFKIIPLTSFCFKLWKKLKKKHLSSLNLTKETEGRCELLVILFQNVVEFT